MVIKISHLPVGIHNISFKEDVKNYQLNEKFVDNLILDCKLDKSPHQIVINCNLTNFVKLSCDRCNDDFVEEFNSEFVLTYLYKKVDEEENLNVKYISFTEDKIDLTEDVLEFARLSVPMKHLCSEDCKGLCSSCGVNLNHKKCSCNNEINDPVWEPLMKLKDKLN